MPYAILHQNETLTRAQVSRALNMAVVQTEIERNDALMIPTLCQSIVFDTITVGGELKIDGELVFI